MSPDSFEPARNFKRLKGPEMKTCFRVLFAALFLLAGLAYSNGTETEYFALFLEGKKIGHAVATRTVEEGIVTTSETLKMTVSRAGSPMPISTTETSIETVDAKPLGFESVMDMGGMGQKVSAKINDQGKFQATITAMGMTQNQTIDLPPSALMAEGIRQLHIEKGLVEGTAYNALMFSPILLGALQGQIKVGPTKQIDLLGRSISLTEID